MDNDEFQRLVLLALAEMVTALGDMVYAGPARTLHITYRDTAEELLRAAVGGEDARAAGV